MPFQFDFLFDIEDFLVRLVRDSGIEAILEHYDFPVEKFAQVQVLTRYDQFLVEHGPGSAFIHGQKSSGKVFHGGCHELQAYLSVSEFFVLAKERDGFGNVLYETVRESFVDYQGIFLEILFDIVQVIGQEFPYHMKYC